VTLKEILATNPGISVTEALQRLHQINAANALGLGTGVLPKMANPQALNQATKLMREIYIGNMPPGTTVPQLTDFINSTMTQMKLAIPSPFGGPVVSVWISTDSHYAFVELRTVEEASAALNHLGVVPFGGYHLRVGRPKTNSTTQAMNMIGSLPLGVGSLLSMSGTTPVAPIGATPATNDAKDVIMVSNLPDSILESQVRELLEPFGEVPPPPPPSPLPSCATHSSLPDQDFQFHQSPSPWPSRCCGFGISRWQSDGERCERTPGPDGRWISTLRPEGPCSHGNSSPSSCNQFPSIGSTSPRSSFLHLEIVQHGD
jgi:hypothetical protein